jgi:uncharacterized protein affecting Mg2+/Co2+ transport
MLSQSPDLIRHNLRANARKHTIQSSHRTTPIEYNPGMYSLQTEQSIQVLARAELVSVKNLVIHKSYAWRYTIQLLNRREYDLHIKHYHFFVHGLYPWRHEVHGPGLGPHHHSIVNAGCLVTATHQLHTHKPNGLVSGYLRATERSVPFQIQIPAVNLEVACTMRPIIL